MNSTKHPNQNENVAAEAAAAGGDAHVEELSPPAGDATANEGARSAPVQPTEERNRPAASEVAAEQTDSAPEMTADAARLAEDGAAEQADAAPSEPDVMELFASAPPATEEAAEERAPEQPAPIGAALDEEADDAPADAALRLFDEADGEAAAEPDGKHSKKSAPKKQPPKAARNQAPAPKRKAPRRRDEGETNLKIIKIFLAAGVLLAIALVVVMVLMNREGEQADAYANQLLEAYENQAAAVPASPTAEPEPTESPEPEATPDVSATPELDEYGEPIIVTPTPEPVEETDTEADAEAMAEHDEHSLDDGSHEGVDESADYVQPEAPEADEAEQIIAEVVNKVGEDGIIGVITIPEIDVRLPIIGKWSYSLLKISVCRYKGPAVNSKGNLVVIGHNYRSGAHFGNLDQLSEGSAIYLTDSNSNKVRYEVYKMTTIAPDAFSALNTYKGTNGLTLMTCKNQGQNRLLVRCVQKDADIPAPR